ncbi:hypothetical protein LTS01_025954, partial [Friedmanniomyces endolithicus]
MNPQNLRPRLSRRRRELNLPIYPPRPQESRIQDIEAIGGHDDFDALGGLETIELVEELQHRALDFRVAAAAALDARGADGDDFDPEDERGSVLAGHDEELEDHAGALAD